MKTQDLIVMKHTILISSAAEEPVPSPQGWEVNEYCRAVYSDDGLEYEGRIMAVGERYGH